MVELFIWIFFILLISPMVIMALMWLAGVAYGFNQIFKVHPALAVIASLAITWVLFS